MKFIQNFLLKGLIVAGISSLLCSSAIAATITIAGTGDSQHLLRQLALAFQKTHPDTQILVPNSVGSGGGIKLLLSGRTELARIARPLKPKEQAEGLHAKIFAYSPVVFVANLPTPCVQNISATEFTDILRGEITSWNQLGDCPDHKIYVANREEGDSSKTVLETHIPAIKEIHNPIGRTIYSTPEAYDTINHYQFSFGYLPKAQTQKGHLTILNYEGVSSSIENVQQGSYPLVVPLGIVWRDQPTGLTKEFLDYLFSPEAQKLLREQNSVPANPE